jgi:GMP synthase-like glutamine amidotransferase
MESPPSILILRHVPFEGMGRMATYWEKRGLMIQEWVATSGATIPALNQHRGLIIMGGPMGANDDERLPWMAEEKRLIKQAIQSDIPILGFCLGAQLIASVLGARVASMGYKEIGWWPVYKTDEGESMPALSGFPKSFTAFHWHGDAFSLPPEATRLFRSEGCGEQGFVWDNRVWGFQFHPEIGPLEAGVLKTHCGGELSPSAPWVGSPESLENPDRQWVETQDLALGIFLDHWVS